MCGFAGKNAPRDPSLTMDALYQLSYVGAEGNRIAAASCLSGAVGKVDRHMLTRCSPPRAGSVPIHREVALRWLPAASLRTRRAAHSCAALAC